VQVRESPESRSSMPTWGGRERAQQQTIRRWPRRQDPSLRGLGEYASFRSERTGHSPYAAGKLLIMRRREFVTLLGGAAVAWPLAARAQQPAMPTIAWLDSQSRESTREAIPAFQQGLAETGYVEGRNVVIEYHWVEGNHDRLQAFATDLVRRHVAVIAAVTTPSALAAKAATQTIPVVFRIGSDPVELGLVAGFNRPAGNVTGVALLAADITAKRLGVLHELVPTVASIAMLINPDNPIYAQAETRDLQSAARGLGVRVLVLNGGTESDIAAGFASLAEQRAGALLISADTFFYAARDQIISLAAHYAIPTMFFESASVTAGGLLSYGPDLLAGNHQVGLYAGRILRGEKPADLPVARTTKFELAINLKTAKTLGLTMPPTILAMADRVIE
jgi:putative ABC transport system substrate-binding protein